MSNIISSEHRAPVYVSCGVGRDSVGMLVRMSKIGWRPDAIGFANTGSEKRATYEYIPILNTWLRSVNFPELTIVQYTPKIAPYQTLEGNMVLNATLPGAALNQHTCAMKFKVEPQAKWTRKWKPAQEAWARGQKVRKLIGFECGEEYRMKRADARAHSGKGDKKEAERYVYDMPLIDWKMDLEACIAEIKSVGLPVPEKSACYFCPFQQTHEVDSATAEDRTRTMLIELCAEPYNKKVRGLWRRPRKADGRPGSITEYILKHNLDFVPLEQLCDTIVLNDKCQKARNGVTFQAPHTGPTLREQLEAAGQKVPQVVTREQWDGTGRVYEESAREAPAELENELHWDIIEEAA
jgi:hypothetical protein